MVTQITQTLSDRALDLTLGKLLDNGNSGGLSDLLGLLNGLL